MDVSKKRFQTKSTHNINLLTPEGRRSLNIHLVKVTYLCIHCLSELRIRNAGVVCQANNLHYGYIHRDEAKQLTQEARFMKIGKMFPSDYLRGIDVDKPFIVTIKAVTAERVKNHETGKQEDEFVMRFEELEKKLRLNLTMAKACSLVLNDEEGDTDNWIGKRVTIYRDTVKSFGKEHIVPRIREIRQGDVDLKKVINQAQPKNGKNGKQPEGPTWEEFLAKMKANFNLDEAGVKAKLKELEYTSYKASKAQEMYDSIEVLMSQKDDQEPEQPGMFEEDEPVGVGAYSEDMGN